MGRGRRHAGGGVYTLVSRLESEKSMEYLICYSCMVWRLVWLVPVHCHIDKDTNYSTPFPT